MCLHVCLWPERFFEVLSILVSSSTVQRSNNSGGGGGGASDTQCLLLRAFKKSLLEEESLRNCDDPASKGYQDLHILCRSGSFSGRQVRGLDKIQIYTPLSSLQNT